MDKKDWKIGDVIYEQWGYDCTIVDFYKIVKRTAKSITVVKLESKVKSGDAMRVFWTVPSETETGITKIARLNKYGSFKFSDKKPHSCISLYEGKPVWNNTGYAF